MPTECCNNQRRKKTRETNNNRKLLKHQHSVELDVRMMSKAEQKKAEANEATEHAAAEATSTSPTHLIGFIAASAHFSTKLFRLTPLFISSSTLSLARSHKKYFPSASSRKMQNRAYQSLWTMNIYKRKKGIYRITAVASGNNGNHQPRCMKNSTEMPAPTSPIFTTCCDFHISKSDECIFSPTNFIFWWCCSALDWFDQFYQLYKKGDLDSTRNAVSQHQQQQKN